MKQKLELSNIIPSPCVLAAEVGTSAQNNDIHGIILKHGKLKVANRLRELESGGEQKAASKKIKQRPRPMTAASKLTIPAKGGRKSEQKALY